MTTAARVPAPKDLGETTIRMVVEFLPDACEPSGDGSQLLTPEALRLAYAIKGLRGQQAGERTIRRVLQAPDHPDVVSPKIVPFSRRKPPEAPAPTPSSAELLETLELQRTQREQAMADLEAKLDRLGKTLETSARPDRYDAFLGSLTALAALSRRRPFPLGPNDPA